MNEPPFTTELLRMAYGQGYFPMPDPVTSEILWFHPNPRAILPLDKFHCSRSLQRTLKRTPFIYTIDRDFAGVLDACADREDTWIDSRFKMTYAKLHEEGEAHSIEVWLNEDLVGGVYGVSLRGAFFAESMFHRVTDASKAALHFLVLHMRNRGMSLLEVQFLTPHLASLGAIEISRHAYMQLLKDALDKGVCFV